MKKLLLGISIISLLAVGCSRSVPVKPGMSNTPPPEETVQKPDMANWKTYENKKLGFKISYPSAYQITENPTDLPKPENDPNFYKGTVLVLSNADAGEQVYGLIYVKKVKDSLKSQTAKQFSPFLTSMNKYPTDGDLNNYWVFNYFTASASDSLHTYVLAKTPPDSPADNGSKIDDILIAEVQSAYNGDIIPEVTQPDWIARTIDFIK